jgi:hypothetical protein
LSKTSKASIRERVPENPAKRKKDSTPPRHASTGRDEKEGLDRFAKLEADLLP